ncbi:hypothetical protein [Plesiocystis pacifica]|uniref:hypothetical protein n=1 Tax=Plesiocystis pacifica TaxID=191768 RepID=UPI0012FBCD77|nr:hypothetical protein [Plesiocystis pacifica]
MSDPLLEEVRSIIGGVPTVLARMHAKGELEEHWPAIRNMLAGAQVLGGEIMFGMLAAFALRCSVPYCFTIYSSRLERIDGREIGAVFEFPDHVPRHDYWSRVLKLAWLVTNGGPHDAVARHLLRGLCSPEEYTAVIHLAEASRVVRAASERFGLTPADEPALERLPEPVRAQIPEFIQFHTEVQTGRRPVVKMCSACRKVASADDQWFPFEAAEELVPAGAIYSHGLCEPCLQRALADAGLSA